MKYLVFSVLVFLSGRLAAQTASDIAISFIPSYEKSAISLKDTYGKNNLQIEALKFYISKVELYKGSEVVFAEVNSFHLLDISDPGSMILDLKIPDNLHYSQIRFNIGVDSITNVSGAFGGNLDPGKGMYWTWQSGYINFKLEGVADNCPARNHRFQFHLGGYQAPFNALQEVALEVSDTKNIQVNIALDQLFEQINLQNTFQIMSPSHQALEMAQLLASLFSISTCR